MGVVGWRAGFHAVRLHDSLRPRNMLNLCYSPELWPSQSSCRNRKRSHVNSSSCITFSPTRCQWERDCNVSVPATWCVASYIQQPCITLVQLHTHILPIFPTIANHTLLFYQKPSQCSSQIENKWKTATHKICLPKIKPENTQNKTHRTILVVGMALASNEWSFSNYVVKFVSVRH